MDSRIGTILREARNRRKIELAEVEAATRIRLRFLRAIEREEWDVLPGGVYTRGFIRTYATFLGLDGQRLADEYRRDAEGANGSPLPLADSGSTAADKPPSSPNRRRPGAAWLAIPAVLLVAVLAIVFTPGDQGGGDNGARQSPSRDNSAQNGRDSGQTLIQERHRGVSVQLAASVEVWVCLLDAKDRHLIDGRILEAGAEEGPFRSGSFTLSFGNGGISMLVNGKQADIPATSSPIGFSIGHSGQLTELSEAERPSCA
jgi:cytoskeleton protein RodZ